jgi:hypothetical protein
MSDEGYNEDIDWDQLWFSEEEESIESLDKDAQDILDRLDKYNPDIPQSYPCKGMVFELEEKEVFMEMLPYLTQYAEEVNYKEIKFKLPFQDYEVEVFNTLN